MSFDWVRGATSFLFTVAIQDSSSAVGALKPGLTNASTNLTIEMRRAFALTKTTYSGANIESIAALGVFVNPSANTKIRFKETDMAGVYEVQVHDTATNGGGSGDLSPYVDIKIYESGTTALNIVPTVSKIALVDTPASITDVWNPSVCASRTLSSAQNITSTGGTILIDVNGRMELDPAGIDQVLIESGITPGPALVNDAGTPVQLTSVNARQALSFCSAILGGLLNGADVNALVFKALGKNVVRASATTAATGRTGSNIILPS